MTDRQLAFCHSCKLYHLAAPGSHEAAEFALRHRSCHVELVPHEPAIARLHAMLGVDLFRPLRRLVDRFGQARSTFAFERLGVAGYRGNADVKEAFGTVDTFTITNLNSLATSATAGWKSAAIDNTSNKFLDYILSAVTAAVNTAPANSKAHFLYAYGLTDDSGSDYTSTGDGIPDGSQGTITFPDVTSNAIPIPRLGVIPYPTQNKALNGGPFSFARTRDFGGVLPPKFGLCWINHTGYTIASSGNSVKGRGVYATVI